MSPFVLPILIFFVALIAGAVVGYFVAKSQLQDKQNEARQSAEHILREARKEADNLKREQVLESKIEINHLRQQTENDFKERRNDILKQEQRILQREESLDRKSELLDKKDELLDAKEAKLEQKQQQVDELQTEMNDLITQHQTELERIADLTKDEARHELMSTLEDEIAHDMAILLRDKEAEVKHEADKRAKDILSMAIQRYASDYTAESTVSVVTLPNDDMKGRIIGREGRNIRALETLTGIDLIIDDTPEAVILSGFDPIRREIAKTALENLVHDGRIHPARIEEMVDKARKEIDQTIREAGEQATFDLGIHNIHPDLSKILGRLKYRVSYGQNVLKHSIEVAHLSGMMAAELGLDVTIAKRAGLLHDIGKAIDQEVEGSHVEIGVALAKKYKENKIVINAIASHHGDVEATDPISLIVAAADALSAARPGARRESIENYIKRLERLEEIANNHEGVERTFAIQAGREIRVMVHPDQIDDLKAYRLAKSIREQIEEELQYPGSIKITVIRESRAVEYAK